MPPRPAPCRGPVRGAAHPALYTSRHFRANVTKHEQLCVKPPFFDRTQPQNRRFDKFGETDIMRRFTFRLPAHRPHDGLRSPNPRKRRRPGERRAKARRRLEKLVQARFGSGKRRNPARRPERHGEAFGKARGGIAPSGARPSFPAPRAVPFISLNIFIII